MSLVCRPRREDFFPHTKRGHGSANPFGRRNSDGSTSIVIKKPTACVDLTCRLNAPKSSNEHEDIGSNMRDWCEEHRLSVYSKDRPNALYYTAGEAMYAATGGR